MKHLKSYKIFEDKDLLNRLNANLNDNQRTLDEFNDLLLNFKDQKYGSKLSNLNVFWENNGDIINIYIWDPNNKYGMDLQDVIDQLQMIFNYASTKYKYFRMNIHGNRDSEYSWKSSIYKNESLPFDVSSVYDDEYINDLAGKIIPNDDKFTEVSEIILVFFTLKK